MRKVLVGFVRMIGENMSKLSLVLFLGAMSCLLEEVYSNNFYYYPNSQPALNYQYQPFSPYVYSAYAVPADCDKTTTEGGKEGGSSESSSSESSSSESTEGGSTEGSSEEKKEGSESESSSSSSSEEGEKKEEGEGKKEGEEKKEGEGKKEDSKKKVVQYVFPPVSSFPFAPQTAQQVVYSAPATYPYMPYKTYSQPATYSIKSSGYNTYPYYSLSSVPAAAVPVSTRIVSTPNVARIIAPATYTANSYPAVSKTISFGPASGVGGPAGYWNGNVGYYRV